MSSLKKFIVSVTPFMQNCTLLWEESSKQAVVVDPGGEIEKITKAITENNLSIKEIWLTHGHIDHVGAAMNLKEKLKVKIIGPHKADEPLLQGIEEQAKMFGVEDNTIRNVVPDTWLNEGDKLFIGSHEFKVYHCPGHSPGHVVFYNEREKFAHVGDVLFAGSIGRTDLPLGEHGALLASIKNKLFNWHDDTEFICGHGAGSTIGYEKKHNPFL